jgi:hypothetical protein
MSLLEEQRAPGLSLYVRTSGTGREFVRPLCFDLRVGELSPSRKLSWLLGHCRPRPLTVVVMFVSVIRQASRKNVPQSFRVTHAIQASDLDELAAKVGPRACGYYPVGQ